MAGCVCPSYVASAFSARRARALSVNACWRRRYARHVRRERGNNVIRVSYVVADARVAAKMMSLLCPLRCIVGGYASRGRGGVGGIASLKHIYSASAVAVCVVG